MLPERAVQRKRVDGLKVGMEREILIAILVAILILTAAPAPSVPAPSIKISARKTPFSYALSF